MGPPHMKLIDVVLAEKDEQINIFKHRMEAYAARTSQIQARLLATLDTLDALQLSHAQELNAETRAKEQLSEKLDQYTNIVNAVEAERDDLQDAVLQLIQKVELSNDYSLWPYSRMQITSLLDPILPNKRLPPASEDSQNELISYAAAMITALRLERDVERYTQNQARQQADSRIATLEAQLANREAELEACIAHTDICSQRSQSPQPQPFLIYPCHQFIQDREDDEVTFPPMFQEDVSRVLEIDSARCKALGVEMQSLKERLGGARSSVTQASLTAGPSVSEVHGKTADIVFTPVASSPKLANFPRPLSRTLDVTPALEPGEQSAPTEPSRTGRCSSPPYSLPHAALISPLYSSAPSPTSSRLCLNDLTDTSEIVETPVHPQAILDLDYQINAFAAEVDNFRTERQVQRDSISRERQLESPKTSPQDTFSLVQVMDECAELRHLVTKLSQDLKESRIAAIAREKELLEEIDTLQGRIYIRESPPDRGFSPQLIEMDDGQISMELASPLSPTPFWPSSPVIRDTSPSIIDPPSIPLPISPEPCNEALLHSPPPAEFYACGIPPLLHHKSDAQATLEHLERELAAANQQLEEGENVYRHLQYVAEDLQQHIIER